MTLLFAATLASPAEGTQYNQSVGGSVDTTGVRAIQQTLHLPHTMSVKHYTVI